MLSTACQEGILSPDTLLASLQLLQSLSPAMPEPQNVRDSILGCLYAVWLFKWVDYMIMIMCLTVSLELA